jgi:hypothetical protein
LAEARAEGEKIDRLARKLLAEDGAEAGTHAEAEAALAALDEALRCASHRAIRDAVERVDAATLPVAKRLMDRNISGYLTGRAVADV